MYNACNLCKDRRLIFDKTVSEEYVEWYEWKTKVEERSILQNGKKVLKKITLTEKELICGTVSELIDKLEPQLDQYKKHMFNIRTQFSYYKNKRLSMDSNEFIIHVDFAENYVCKLSTEIQGMHFGASKKQLSLHTGVYYIGGDRSSHTFCTVSDNILHNPASIWAHLTTILQTIKTNYPHINTLHFFSDGPTCQYRQKENFYLLSTDPKKFGFTFVSWNFFAAGHGKGVPDGVGGSLKRSADNKVKYGIDITSAQKFVEYLKGIETLLKVISCEAIDESVGNLKTEAKNLKPIKGTMSLHQIVVPENADEILYRDQSCWCLPPDTCFNHEFTQERILRGENRLKLNSSNNYQSMLLKLKSCKTFQSLKKKCYQIQSALKPIDYQEASFETHGLEVDVSALDVYPDDIPDKRVLYPVKVLSDGNCLPSSGSVFAHGNVEQTAEIRVRIVCELVLNQDKYLDNDFLSQGLNIENTNKDVKKCHLPSQYAQYSDMFLPGTALNHEIIKSIYEAEVLTVKHNRAFMGIWQLHALASVLRMPIFSVYPKLGNPNIRKDLHRLLVPRETAFHNTVYIMWTSNRQDMVQKHWVPNHFVAVIPTQSAKPVQRSEPNVWKGIAAIIRCNDDISNSIVISQMTCVIKQDTLMSRDI